MITHTIGLTPAGHALVRRVAGVPTRIGIHATEAALVAARAG